jgi:hypothetical protein
MVIITRKQWYREKELRKLVEQLNILLEAQERISSYYKRCLGKCKSSRGTLRTIIEQAINRLEWLKNVKGGIKLVQKELFFLQRTLVKDLNMTDDPND